MAEKHLGSYLNDHLAGSVVALELLDHLLAAYAGAPVCQRLADLKSEILADRQELEGLMARRGIGVSHSRKAAAWLAEKLSELKPRVGDPAAGAFRLFEGLEALSLGIEGKRCLSLALSAAGVDGIDCARLERRASEQRATVEAMRLEAAGKALGVQSPPKSG